MLPNTLQNYRKDVTIDFLNLQGMTVLAYRVHRAWVFEYQALPELDVLLDEARIASGHITQAREEE